MEIAPKPDSNYTLEMVYRQNIPALASNSSNWLLSLAPDAYLYGALLESQPYQKKADSALLQVWAAGLSSTIDQLNSLGQVSAFNAGPMVMKTSSQTP